MTLYQKIPTTSSRIDPMMLVAAAGIVLLSVVATAAIVRWLPDGGRAGASPVSPPVPATAASSAASLPAAPAVRKVREQNSQARATQFASA
ncbi:hypothetical protein [Pseudoduganella umbonata]|uniref:Uncharacterized protein n=1 Tax=Pseudoduganella umbonata TaxID=864828 RepID=A0A4V1EDT3_9BURK|nr:hypothetical protein [Pseudoduganella umbonata]MBB3220278.1 hypothetical protein [Pseudoduganella umbonata]QCP12181.1 hypothetical protein FCL38_18440 [Pseudoduganella umbonata]